MDANILNIKLSWYIDGYMLSKQHVSNIWNSIYEEVWQHWGWVEKQSCL